MISPELLRRFPVFGFMDDKQSKAVAMIAEEVTVEKDEVIAEAGNHAEYLYFLINGDVAYYVFTPSKENPQYQNESFIWAINPGEIFGISALIEPFNYTATVKADRPSRVIRIKAPNLRDLCQTDLKLSIGFYHAIAMAAMERLRQMQYQLASVKV